MGEFNLEGISAAPRGTPQIEVTFDIDANGILHVSAKDKATGKENKVTIKANSGLSEDEINKMVLDAEENAEQDKARVELVGARNAAEALVHSVKASLEEHGGKLDSAEKDKIESAMKESEEALKTEDHEKIKKATEGLTVAAQKLGELSMAANNSGGDAQPANDENSTTDVDGGDDSKDEKKVDNVVDADFKEVKRD